MKHFKASQEYIDIEKLLHNIAETGEIPERFPEYFYSQNGTPYFQLRHWFAQNCSWCLISWEWLKLLNDNIIQGGRCLEICAGQGLLSHSLQTLGTNVIATDDYSWIEANEMSPHYYTEVTMKKGVLAIRNFAERDGLDFVLLEPEGFEKRSGQTHRVLLCSIPAGCFRPASRACAPAR